MKIARVRLATNISRILFVALAVPISACATASAPNEGVVIDTSTGKPIPEAFVVAQWTYRHSTIHTVRTSCAYL
jgi:hypothetical protein